MILADDGRHGEESSSFIMRRREISARAHMLKCLFSASKTMNECGGGSLLCFLVLCRTAVLVLDEEVVIVGCHS